MAMVYGNWTVMKRCISSNKDRIVMKRFVWLS